MCRVPNHANRQYCGTFAFEVMNIEHSDETIDVLKKIGLCQVVEEDGKTKLKFDKRLIAGKYTYSANKGEHLIPFNPRVALVTRSSSNIQICDALSI